MRTRIIACLVAEVAVVAFSPRPARADDTKRECITAATEGQTLRKDEKLIEARDQILTCARDVCPPVVKSHCARWLTEVQDQIPTLVVRVQDGNGSDLIDANLTIDGKPAKLDGRPVELDPGNHALRVETKTGASKEDQVLLVDGEKSRRVLLELPGPASATPPPGPGGAGSPPDTVDRTPPPKDARSYTGGGIPAGAWILGAFGVAALGVGGYFTYLASNEFNNLQATCLQTPNGCSDSQKAPGRTYEAIELVGWSVGGVALGSAIIWAVIAVTNHDKGPAVSSAAHAPLEVQPLPGGGLARLNVTF